MEGTTKIDRLTMRTYWLTAAIIIVIASLGATTIIYRDSKSRIDDAGRQVMYLAQALAEHTTQIFAKLEALSRAIMEDRADLIVDESMLSELLRRRAAAEPAAMGIAIIDKEGRVFASGMNDFPVGKDLSSSTDYQVMKRREALEFYISKPYRSDLSMLDDYNSWTMSYSRRVKDNQGNFNGYVLIVVEESYLYGFYSQLRDQPGLVVGLIGEDGIIRASSVLDAVGLNIEQNIREQIITGNGIIIDNSIRTGVERVFALYRSSAAPLLAYVGVPTAPIYKAWLIASSVTVFALLALFAALVTLGVILGKYVKNRHSLISSMVEATHERREKEFLETIVNTGAALMAVTDRAGQIVVANQGLRELITSIDITASKTGVLPPLLGEALDEIISDLPWQGVCPVVVNNGVRRAISWSVSPIFDKADNIKNLVAIGLDITERREAELAIYQSAKLVTLGEMATGIAHEINQPLATLAMAVDNLHVKVSEGNTDQAMIIKNLELAMGQIERAANIVRHMRIYGHRSDGSLQSVDPVNAIEGTLTIARVEIEGHGIEIRCDYTAGQFLVKADLLLIEQILLNFLLNARDAILSKSENQTKTTNYILIALELGANQTVVLSVSDTGGGISEAIFDKLFDPFFTTKPVGKGTGLGLALSHGMARDMDGYIEAYNTDLGAKFMLILRDARTTGNDR